MPDGSDQVQVARRRPRVLMVTARYLPLVGGVELHVAQVAPRLAAQGLEVTVLTTDRSRALPPEEYVDGVHVRRVRAWPEKRDYYFAPRIYGEIARGSWDVVHVQSFQTLVAPLAMLAARRSGLPYVVTFHAGGHSSAVRRAIRPVQLSVVRPLLARADRLVALAPFEIDYYSKRLRLPRERFVLIPNGSDLPKTPTLPATLRDDALIASVGRLERYKGHHRVIAALPHVLRSRPDVRLWIGGSGSYEPALKLLAETLGVSDRIEIQAVPPGEREEMAKRLSRVKVVIALSEFETQPIAALEALALGCRLIVADTPGLSVLAGEGFARAIPLTSSAEDVAATIVDELDKPQPTEAPRLPTWDECADALFELYGSVAS